MEKLNTLKEIIINKVIPETLSLKIGTTKRDVKNIEIEDSQNLNSLTQTIEKISKEYNIEMDKIFIGVVNDYDGGTFCASFDVVVEKTPKEIKKELISLIERKTWKIVYDNMLSNGFKRTGFNSSLLKAFDNTTVYEMVKNNEVDKLVSYYSFRYVWN